MVDALQNNGADRYVCAAELTAHCAGEAGQPLHAGEAGKPLHGFYLADGFPDGRGEGTALRLRNNHGRPARHRNRRRTSGCAPPILKQNLVTTGHDAALAVIQLMDRTATTVDPTAFVTLYAGTPSGTAKAVIDQLWAAFEDPTISVMADGTLTLAMSGESARTQGKGDTRIATENLTAVARRFRHHHADHQGRRKVKDTGRGHPQPISSSRRRCTHARNPTFSSNSFCLPNTAPGAG